MPIPTAVIYCAVLEEEVRAFAASAPDIVRMEKLPQGLHNTPALLRSRLQALIDRIELESPEVEAIVAVYGLCSRGTEGVKTARCRLVLPKAHDCITILLGSRQKYLDYLRRHPGTYWYSPGWIRHHLPPGETRYKTLLQHYIERYGEDNAEYLMDQEQHWFRTYDRAAYVDLGVTETSQDEALTRTCAHWLNWDFDRQHGDPALLKTLLTGPWEEDRYLVLQPGESLRFTMDEGVMASVNAD